MTSFVSAGTVFRLSLFPMSTVPADTTGLVRFLDRWQRRRIVVAGDFMLDQYIHGAAERLSPDAPVPVLAVERQEHRPGGSANVCLDLAALRLEVVCLGVVGADPAGRLLKQALAAKGCDTTGLVVDGGRPTTTKQSFIGRAQGRHPQKMFRVDCEDRTAISDTVARKLLAAADRQLARADVLCLEDYNKGVLTPIVCQGLIRLARKHRVPVLVDPAAIVDYAKYRGATCLTPNRTEAALATGLDAAAGDFPTLRRMAQRLLKNLKLSCVVLTLDKQGALLLDKGGKPVHVPTVARQVYDVTGAGDMVLAMLSGALANGASWPAAVYLANTAAGLEVERFGVVPIALDEVLLALLRQNHAALGKLRTLDQLLPELAAYRSQGRSVAFTNGCFDILHAGHVEFLRQARRTADMLVVGLNSDASIRRIKEPGRPVNHEADRVQVLSELQSVDYIVVFDADTPEKLIRAIRPQVLVKGADYHPAQVVGWPFVQKHGGRLVLVPLVQGRSTSNLIGRIKATTTNPGQRRTW